VSVAVIRPGLAVASAAVKGKTPPSPGSNVWPGGNAAHGSVLAKATGSAKPVAVLP
jgi:hypothetical protein